MDFPLDLTAGKFVESFEEFKQTLKLTLENTVGSFLQDCNHGALFSIHQSDSSLLEMQVKETIERLSNVTVISIKATPQTILVNLNYRGFLYNYEYKLEE
jgi:hypothetical protein